MAAFSWDVDESLDPTKKPAPVKPGATSPIGGYDAVFGASPASLSVAPSTPQPAPMDPVGGAPKPATPMYSYAPSPVIGAVDTTPGMSTDPAAASIDRNPWMSNDPAGSSVDRNPGLSTDPAGSTVDRTPGLSNTPPPVDTSPGRSIDPAAGPAVDRDPGLSNTQGGNAGDTGMNLGDAQGGTSGQGGITQQYQDLMGQIGTAADPQQKEVLKDQLARKVFVSLKTAGHDVKWDGDQLMIDGRPYKVGEGTGQNLGAGGIAPGEGAPNSGPAPALDQPIASPTTPADLPRPGGPTSGFGRLSGFNEAKFNDPNKHDFKYDTARVMSQFDPRAGFTPEVIAALNKLGYGTFSSSGGDKLSLTGAKNAPDAADFTNQDWIFAKDANSDATKWQFGGGGAAPVDNAPGMTNATAPLAIDTRPGMSNDPAQGAAGVTLGDPFAGTTAGGGVQLPSGQWVPRDHPLAAGLPGSTTPGVPGGAGNGGWSPTAPTYQPGTMDNSDLQGYGMDELAGRLGPGTQPGTLATDYPGGKISNDPANFGRVEDNYQAGQVSNDPLNLGRVDQNYQDGRVSDDALSTYSYDGQQDLGPLGAGQTQQQTEDLVARILAHPESMDPRTVEMLKAQTKDELAGQQNQQDEDLTAAGYATGNADSNWLQSEKLASAGRRDQALVASNRAVDMKAAETNAADRKSAATLGQGFAESKAATARGDAAERLAQQQASEGDLQAAAESRAKAQEFHRQAQQINEQMRSDAFATRQKASDTNASRQTTEAGFKRAGEVTNESLRGDAADRRMRAETANIGTSQAEAAFGREGEMANEGLRSEAADRNTKAMQQNIENQFRSTAEKQTAFKLAADTALAAAAQKTDRAAFEEQIKQRATELGQSADKIRQDYVLGLLHEATSRYGIDTGAALDREKLSQAGKEFQQDLAFRLKALATSHDEFGARYGLDVAKTQADIDQQSYDRYKETFG